MVAKSIFHEKFIKKIIDQRYSNFHILDCNFFCEGRNDLFLLKAKFDNYFFRVYRYGYRSEPEILSEIKILLYLSGNGVRVAKPLPDDSGNYITKLDAPEGQRFGVLFEELKGETKKNNFDGKDSYLMGELCGVIHKLFNEYEEDSFTRPKNGLDTLLNESFIKICKSPLSEYSEFSFLNKIHDEIGYKLPTLISKYKPRWGICHGDLNTGNVKFHQNSIGIYDFDAMCYSWHIYDSSCFLWDLYFPIGIESEFMKEKRKKYNKYFYEGYLKNNKVDRQEAKLIGFFLIVRDFWLMGIHTEEKNYKGIQRFSEKYLRNTINTMKLQIEENEIDI